MTDIAKLHCNAYIRSIVDRTKGVNDSVDSKHIEPIFCIGENSNAPCGIHLILGPMFSGKTGELLRLMDKYERQNVNTVLLRKSNTHRKGIDEKRVSMPRSGGWRKECVEVDDLCDLDEGTMEKINKASVIGIDEGQFLQGLACFCKRFVFCEKHCNKCTRVESGDCLRPKLVIVAMLNGTYLQKPFEVVLGDTPDLLALTTSITYLTAICFLCKCDNATYTLRWNEFGSVNKSNGKTERIGSDEYQPVCCKCLIKIKTIT